MFVTANFPEGNVRPPPSQNSLEEALVQIAKLTKDKNVLRYFVNNNIFLRMKSYNKIMRTTVFVSPRLTEKNDLEMFIS